MDRASQRVSALRNRSVRQSSALRSGFTLVEIMVVVMIVGVLAALAIPAFSRARRNALATRTAQDFRTFEAAFEQYAMQNGHWPTDVNRGLVPPGMLPYLRGTAYTQVTSVGGFWDWDLNQFGFKAGISIVASDVDEAIVQRIDEILDDGNLATGRFRRTGGERFTLILEE